MKLGMVIQTDRCVGCQTCAISCKVNNQLPGEFFYNRVETKDNKLYVASGEAPNVKITMMPQQCNHCEDPACMTSCPYNAIEKKENGIVAVKRDVCIGCANCVTACPYGNVALDPIYQRSGKCDLCEKRILSGNDPFCVESCPSKARSVGDLNDINSKVSKLIESEKGYVLKPEKNTNPKVYYVPGK